MTRLSLRAALRALTRQKFIFTVAILTLAVGVSLSTAMLAMLYGVMLRPIAYDDDRRLFVAWAGYEGSQSERESFTELALVEWRARARAFDGVAGFRYAQFTLLQRGDPTDLQAAAVSPEFFAVLEVQPALGGVFDPELARAEQGKVIVLSDRLWRQRFGGDPDIAGQRVNLGGELYTVTGVMPADFDVPSRDIALWAPLPISPATTAAQLKSLMVIARRRPSVSVDYAQSDAAAVARQLAAEYPEAHRGMRIHLVPLLHELTRDAQPLLIVANAVALLVLLICCANVSNLLLVRAIERRAEFFTRLAVGARRRDLLGAVFTESLLLATGGGIIGAGLAWWMIEALARWSPVELPRAAAVGQGLQIPAAAGGWVVASAVLISVPAVWEVARLKLSSNAAVGARTTSRHFAGHVIVTLEIAIALTLVAASGLMARTSMALRDANPGWRTDHLLAAHILLPRAGYAEPHQIRQFYETFIERLRATPGVVSAAASSAMPAGSLGADIDVPIQVPGRSTNEQRQAAVRLVTPGFFKTLGIPVIQGRDLDEADGDPKVRRVVVNQAFARRHLSDSASVMGRQVTIVLGAPQTYEIVGMVGDVHHYGMLRDPKPEFYLPFASRPFGAMGVVVRTDGDPTAFAPTFRKQLWTLDSTLPVASTESMDDMLRDTWSDRLFLTTLIVAFTFVVVVLTVVGVFSVVTYSVSRQTRVIAIHMALGAQAADAVRLVMRQSARTVAVGTALGLLGAWMLGRGLAGVIYGVSASDSRVLLIATVGVIIVASIGAYLPSRRAARVDPMIALRID